MVRVKPSDSAGSEYPLSLHDGEIDLMRGFSLSSSEGIGSAWKAQSSTETFDDRFGRWCCCRAPVAPRDGADSPLI